MSREKYVFLVAAVLACVCIGAAHPKPRSVDLTDAVNRTVCPIEVVVDKDPHRIPCQIKLLKCAPNPSKWCIAQHIPSHECCAHIHNNHIMECVEIHDTMLVKYPHSDKPNKTVIYDVAVGCSCMVTHPKAACSLPGPSDSD